MPDDTNALAGRPAERLTIPNAVNPRKKPQPTPDEQHLLDMNAHLDGLQTAADAKRAAAAAVPSPNTKA